MRNLFKQKNTLNQTSEVQCHKTHTQIAPSQAMFTMTGPISKTLNILNPISEEQCHKMLTQIALFRAMYTMTGLISKTQSIHNQTLEEQCHKTLTQIAPSQATFTTIGLTHNKMNQTHQILIPSQVKKMYNLMEQNWFQFGNMTIAELSQKDSPLKEMTD